MSDSKIHFLTSTVIGGAGADRWPRATSCCPSEALSLCRMISDRSSLTRTISREAMWKLPSTSTILLKTREVVNRPLDCSHHSTFANMNKWAYLLTVPFERNWFESAWSSENVDRTLSLHSSSLDHNLTSSSLTKSVIFILIDLFICSLRTSLWNPINIRTSKLGVSANAFCIGLHYPRDSVLVPPFETCRVLTVSLYGYKTMPRTFEIGKQLGVAVYLLDFQNFTSTLRRGFLVNETRE